MAGRNLASVKARVWQYLRDELSSTVTAHTFGAGELDSYINRALIEVSEASPYENIVTALTIGTDKTIDISTLRNTLLEVVKAEYPISQTPKQYRGVSVWGDTLTLDYSSTIAAASSIYLITKQIHELDRTSSTMNYLEEDVVVLGASVYAGQAWLNNIRTELAESIALVSTVETTIGLATARLAAAVTDLGTARTAMGTAATSITAATAAAVARIVQAVADLSTARTAMGTAATSVTTATTAAIARVVQAVADLASARAAIGSTGISDPVNEYQRIASGEMQTAMGYFQELPNLLAPVREYESLGANEIRAAMSYFQELPNLLAPVREYESLGANEIRAASGELQQATSYMREINTQLTEARTITQYQTWINTQLSQYRDRLNRLTKNAYSQEYARG